jgi:anthranilate synthase component 1
MEISTKPKIKIQTRVKRMLSDTLTPVSLYLKVRDHYSDPVLLESNDFSSIQDCFSFLGLQSIGGFAVKQGKMRRWYPDGSRDEQTVEDVNSVPEGMREFLQRFEVSGEAGFQGVNGLFGHTCFDGVQYFDTLQFDPAKRKMDIPDMRYLMYRFVIAINHFKEELYLLENLLPGQKSEMERLESLIQGQKFSTHTFQLSGEEKSNLTDRGFMDLVTAGKKHCQLGDVFQIVFSRQFSQGFVGDEFNVYRVLRSINPSPFLFYFDYGSYKIFGSSPEVQMLIKDGVATVNPIAGTYRRTGNDVEDAKHAQELVNDPKENAEHIMLVDLARNDLGRHARNIRVKELKEIQFYSHVIHLVSKVQGDLDKTTNPIRVFGDTFPAGTLSGAPKYKAIELINQYENQNRSFYGGGLGFINFNGEMTQAIVIRSFLSKGNTLYYQAGAGVVNASVEEKELQEVNNKLGALTKALREAEKI